MSTAAIKSNFDFSKTRFIAHLSIVYLFWTLSNYDNTIDPFEMQREKQSNHNVRSFFIERNVRDFSFSGKESAVFETNFLRLSSSISQQPYL